MAKIAFVKNPTATGFPSSFMTSNLIRRAPSIIFARAPKVLCISPRPQHALRETFHIGPGSPDSVGRPRCDLRRIFFLVRRPAGKCACDCACVCVFVLLRSALARPDVPYRGGLRWLKYRGQTVCREARAMRAYPSFKPRASFGASHVEAELRDAT